MSRVKSKLSYANVMATIAVFLALGGGAYAAITIPKKSVGAKQLKANAVKTAKIANSAVTGPKVADGAVTATKLASGAAFKNVVLRETVVANIGNNASQIEQINCQAGEVPLSGGGVFAPVGSRNLSLTEIGTDVHLITPVDASGDAAVGGSTPAGYLVSLLNDSGVSRDFHGYVVCGQK